MELRQIRFALAVARHGAVRRAAATLHVDQAIVSAKTRDLEAELGVRLFERHSGGVRLTGPGRLFMDGATRALRALDDTAAQVRSAGRGQSGALNIGYAWAAESGRLAALLSEQRRETPEVAVGLKEHSVEELIGGLFDRTADIAFLVEDDVPETLNRHRLWSERLYFAVPAASSASNEAGWALLDEHPLLVGAREDWTLYQVRAAESGRQGLRPQVHDCSRAGILTLVAAERGMAILPASACQQALAGVRFLPIVDGNAQSSVCAAWLPGNDNPALKAFLQLLKRPARPVVGPGNG